MHFRFSLLFSFEFISYTFQKESVKYNSGRFSWLWIPIQIFEFPTILPWLPMMKLWAWTCLYLVTFVWENCRHFATRPPLAFPAKWQLRNKNSILMACHYPDLGSASDWSCHERNLISYRRHTSFKFKVLIKLYQWNLKKKNYIDHNPSGYVRWNNWKRKNITLSIINGSWYYKQTNKQTLFLGCRWRHQKSK